MMRAVQNKGRRSDQGKAHINSCLTAALRDHHPLSWQVLHRGLHCSAPSSLASSMYSLHHALAAGKEDRFPLQLTAGNLLLIFLTLKQPSHKPPPGCSWKGRASSVQEGDSSSTLEREGTSLAVFSLLCAIYAGPIFYPSPSAVPALGTQSSFTSSKFHSLMVGREHQSTQQHQRLPKETPSVAGSGARDSALPDESAHNCP